MLFADFPPTFAAFSHATINAEIPFARVAFSNLVTVFARLHFVAPFTRPDVSVVVVALGDTRSTNRFHSAATALLDFAAVGGTIKPCTRFTRAHLGALCAYLILTIMASLSNRATVLVTRHFPALVTDNLDCQFSKPLDGVVIRRNGIFFFFEKAARPLFLAIFIYSAQATGICIEVCPFSGQYYLLSHGPVAVATRRHVLLHIVSKSFTKP